MQQILITGRGPSIYDHDWSTVTCPIMAVSSGIFAVPEHVQVDHFVTMDPLKFFMAGLTDACDISWCRDERATHTAFWRDDLVTKHVLRSRLKPASYRTLPEEIWDVIPDQHLRQFQKAMTNTLHAFGFQPSWGDCPNVRGWDIGIEDPPSLDGDGRLGIEGVRNSWLMAVQIAAKLGYRRILFAGCDFSHDCYDAIAPTIERWHGIFADAGIEWINLSPGSRLACWLPTREVTPA